MDIGDSFNTELGFSFAEFPSDEEFEAEERERLAELKELAKEIKEQAKDSDNSSIPDFVWCPVVNIFEDVQDYIEVAISNQGGILEQVGNLRRKYRDYFDYLDALSRWNEYREWVEEEYGSWETFVEAAHEGIVTVPVIPEPQLKKIRENRGLRKLKYTLSRVDLEGGPSKEVLRKVIDETEDSVETYEDDLEFYTHLSTFNSKEERRAAALHRIRSLRKLDARMEVDPRADAIMQFIRQDTDSDFAGILRPKSFAEEMEAMHEYDFMPQDMVDDIINGLGRPVPTIGYDFERKFIVDQRKRDLEEFYRQMDAAGFDVAACIDGTSMDKKAKRAYKRSLGIVGSSEKEIKKMKKAQKKRAKVNKALADRLTGDARTRDILMHNKIMYDRDDDALSFTLDSILKSEE